MRCVPIWDPSPVVATVTSIIATAEGFLWVFVFGPSRRGGEEDDAGAAATPEVTPEAGHQRHELSFPDVIMDLVRCGEDPLIYCKKGARTPAS